MNNNWLDIEEFSKSVKLSISQIEEMVQKGELNQKIEDGKKLIELNSSTYSLIPSLNGEIVDKDSSLSNGISFAEKTIGTILSLHEKVLDAKDETLDALKSENRFLKEALFSMQELYDEDRKTVETLTKQLEQTQEELEFARRTYNLMCNPAVENF